MYFTAKKTEYLLNKCISRVDLRSENFIETDLSGLMIKMFQVYPLSLTAVAPSPNHTEIKIFK